MNKYYPKLFEPIKIGNFEVKNRILKNSMGTYLCNPDCSVSMNNIKAAMTFAKGGAGLVFMDNAVVVPMYHMGISAENDKMIPGLTLIAEAIKEHGASAGLQLAHPGRDTGFVGGDNIIAASRITYEPWFEMGAKLPVELSVEGIKELTEAYGKAAKRARIAGFDIVEIHAACGCIPHNFLSPHDNQRNDMYGGSLHNRMRFLVEIVRSIKKHAGADYPISVKLDTDDYEPEGIRIDEAIITAQTLEKEGVALLNLCTGTHANTPLYSSSFYPLGYMADDAAIIKAAVNIPVSAVGSIQTPEKGEEILEQGKADIISMGRAFLADPEWPAKAEEGRAEDIVPCIRCMVGCMDKGMSANRVVHCAVNPTLHKFECEKYIPTKSPKKIAVIGAGPAGLEAAITAKIRGHEVTLFEKNEIGGTLVQASAADFKADIRRLIDYYKVQLKKNKVMVINEEATADKIINGGFDTAIIAVGGKERKLDFENDNTSNVAYALDYLGNKTNFQGKKAVVVGGGITGSECALELAKDGMEVTIVEALDKFLDIPSTVIPGYMEAIENNNIKVLVGSHLHSIKNGTAVIADRFGTKTVLDADAVVIAAGYTPCHDLAEKLAVTDIKVIEIGDCKQVRQIYDAVHEGYFAGRNI